MTEPPFPGPQPEPDRVGTIPLVSGSEAAGGEHDRTHGSTLFRTESDKLPASLPIRLLRWWIPAALCLIGTVLLVADDFDTFGVSAFAAFAGAGSSTWLINYLWRLGVSGDDERDKEAKAREYLAKHGHWPDQEH